MTVTGEETVEYRRFNGYRDPRYPEGTWWGVVSVTGDASGGFALLQLIFTLSSQGGRNSRLYSLEQVSIDSSLTTAAVPRLQTTNMSGPRGVSLAHRYALPIILTEATNAPTIDAQHLSFLPLFLGEQRSVGVESNVNVTFINVNTIFFAFEAQGYWWGTRSILADGGPQRPPTGLYPA